MINNISLITWMLLMTIFGTSVQAAPVVLEGKFGKLVLDSDKPALSELFLRTPEGFLEPQSLLSRADRPWLRGTPTWGTQAYTYVVDPEGKRYESRFDAPDKVEQSPGLIQLTGVKLTEKAGGTPVALEDWTLEVREGELVWTVERTLTRDFQARLTASPGLFFSNRPYDSEKPLILENCVSTTLWVNPEHIKASYDPLYRPAAFTDVYIWSRNNMQVIDTPDTWAILKLWTNWHNRMDLRVAVQDAFLYRRGWFGWCSEAGAIDSGEYPQAILKGKKEKTSLSISGVDKSTTGYQLQVSVPDKAMESTLKSWYSSLLNGGVVCDQKNYDMGNESDGWYYGGSSWMEGVAIQAGVPAAGSLAPDPFDVSGALREKTRHVISTLRPDNRTQYGYNISADFVDDNLHNVIGTRIYMLHTGDTAYAAQQIPDMERMLEYFLTRINDRGVFDFGGMGHWFYDAMPSSGVNIYHNTFLYKALLDLAEMERVTGVGRNAERYEQLAADLKTAINNVFWNEDAPGGPRYTDWIRPEGTRIEYAADICQFAPVALGISSIEQGRQLLATIDKRIVELENEYGYAGRASLSAYWPVPDLVCAEWMRKYSVYMNGGSFMCQTYWEIMARARCGDADGAYDRLKKFSEEVRESSFMGNNWYDLKGDVGFGASDEPYLSDMIAVGGSLVNGLFGVNPTWAELEVKPSLPQGWTDVAADVVYKGFRHRITIKDGQVAIEKMERVITPPAQLQWEIRPQPNPAWKATRFPWQESIWSDDALNSVWKVNIARYWNNNDGWMADKNINLNDGQFISLSRVNNDPDCLAVLPLNEGSMDFKDASSYASRVAIHGTGIEPGVEGPQGGTATLFQNKAGELRVEAPDRFSFTESESFTLQAWFKTASQENMSIVARPGAYNLGVKEGRLAGWVMQDGNQFVEARGATAVADGQWHHAACVVDRVNQKIALYLDGKLDSGESAANPLDISAIGRSTQVQPLYVGSFGSSFYFEGNLAGISIHRIALTPEQFSYPQPYAHVARPVRYVTQGVYQARSCFWGYPSSGLWIEVDAQLNGGTATATVELSDDGFQTIKATSEISLQEGKQDYQPPELQGPHQAVRVAFLLQNAPGAKSTPEVVSLCLRANYLPRQWD